MQYRTINVSASRCYDIHIGRGLLTKLGDFIRPLLGGCRLAVLTDSNVDTLYGNAIIDNLTAAGYDACKYVIPAGEASKCAANLLAFLNFLAQEQITRSDAVIAFGGGVVGDLGGLSASLYLRGIKYVQVPTTLLAAVDSSVGGKTAIDIPAGKNLVGSFYQPVLVCCDTALMDTLPADIYRDGCAEVIKYGMILDSALYEKLHTLPFDREEVVARCVEIKRDVVQQDEFDNGIRGLLNFGHTFGHAIETLAQRKGYDITHGEAVSMGILLAAELADAYDMKNPEEGLARRLDEAFLSCGLPIGCPFRVSAMAEIMRKDKKAGAGRVHFVLPFGVGDVRVVDFSVEDVLRLLSVR